MPIKYATDHQINLIALLFLFLLVEICSGQFHSIDLMTGLVTNFNSPLLIQQEGRDNLVVTAEYETKSFDDIPYFVLRLNYKLRKIIFELQFMHHKINLTNTSGEIQHFEITDGFNILSINYRLITKYLDFRFGLGAAITYCNSTVRGYDYAATGGIFNSGYYISGPVLLLGLNKEIDLSKHFYLNAETQFTSAWSLVPIAGGYGYVSNFALHLLLGIGYKF